MCLFPPATMADCLPSYKNDRVIAACDIQGDSKRRKLSATKRKRDRSFSEWKDMKLRRPIKRFKTCRNQTFPSQLGSVWMLPSNRLWRPCNTVCCQKMSKVALHEWYTWYNLSSIDSYIGYMHLWTYQVHLLRPWSWKLWSIFRAFETCRHLGCCWSITQPMTRALSIARSLSSLWNSAPAMAMWLVTWVSKIQLTRCFFACVFVDQQVGTNYQQLSRTQS